MKKYLMTGIAALALGAGFTSCSHDIEPMTQEEINQIEAQKIVQTYEQAFVKTFGQPAANQNWGFGAANLRTRAISDMKAGSNKNRNEWAATDGDFKLIVPTPLTEGQKLRVQKYFQTHAKLTWIAPDMTNYFVQQVYKGNPNTAGDLSAEQYATGNGKSVKSSDHMNKLTIGDNNVHVLDFNNGDNPNNAKDVLDNNQDQHGKNYHSDQITLMIGVQPTCVGFHVTEGNVQHNDCMALASAKDIDDWARNEANFVDGKAIGEDVWYGKDKDGYDNSYWNRSFVGLDYEQITLANCLTDQKVTMYNFQKDWVWDGKKLWKKSDYIAQNGEVLKYDKKEIYFVKEQTNEICAQNVDESQQTWYLTRMDATSQGGNSSEEVIDLTKINNKLSTNSYPVWNGGMQKWVKNVGGRDYVFSDWIVTLTPAKEYTNSTGGGDNPGGGSTTTNADLRIIAEDLSVGDGDEDFDFNDVVFDVYYGAEGTAKAVILAAGGTLDLKVDGREVHALFGSQYAGKMINTNGTKNSDANVRAKSVDDLAPVEIPLTKEVRTPAQARDNIKVEVYKNGQWVELTAIEGKVASKVRVGTDYTWSDERKFVGDGFKAYVAGQANYNDWYVNE